jgi:pSer/pThr/pTyr-binding forkhead associated (FHA) protein
VSDKLQVFVVGRRTAGFVPDIAVPSSEDTVGRKHLELTVGPAGSCYLTDLESANGTFVEKQGRWSRVKQASVQLATRIKLGDYQTTPGKLIDMRTHVAPIQPPAKRAVSDSAASRANSLHQGKRRRNPETGEIE